MVIPKAVCPGCSRHCPHDAVRCKFGQRYFAKQAQKQGEDQPQHKWEKYVARKGLLWRLLWLGCQVKKALRKGKTTEKQLLNALDDADRQQLASIVEKLQRCLEEE